MLKRSGSGPYKHMVEALVNATKDSYHTDGASDPKVITDLIIKAVRAKKPKTRYVADILCKYMIFNKKPPQILAVTSL
jgi:hypothetical protein